MIVSFRGFGALPESVRSYILDNIPDNRQETEGLINNLDGIQYGVPNFSDRWATAYGISVELDKVRNLPDFAAVAALESGLADNLKQGLLKARTYYPWGGGWGALSRSISQQIGLRAAYETIDKNLTRYVDEVQTKMNAARAVLQDRMDKEADAAQQKLLQAKKESEARTTEAEATRAAAAAVAATNQATELKARIEYDKYVAQEKKAKAKAAAPKILGLPLTVAIPGGLAVGIAVLLMLRGSGRGHALSGYRRKKARR